MSQTKTFIAGIRGRTTGGADAVPVIVDSRPESKPTTVRRGVPSGEGATSEGEFWESINTTCTRPVPMVYLIEDNGYAISVPVEVNTPGGSISKLPVPVRTAWL